MRNLQRDNSIYSTKNQITLKRILVFELNSWIGRLFLNRKAILKSENNYLNVACGASRFEGWINADFFSNLIRRKFWTRRKNRPDWVLDLRYPLNCDDNVWDGVFSEHTLEHLYPLPVFNLLKEIYRTMKTGAWLRISVPDLDKYVRYYCHQDVDIKFTKWATGCEAIRSLTQNFRHLSVWDSELLGRFLKEAGFINTREVEFRQGTDRHLLKDHSDRKWESLYMEAQKPT